LRYWEKENSPDPKLTGKTSLGFYNTIRKMIEFDMIQAPKYITHNFSKPKSELNNEIYEYILSGFK